MIVYGYPPIYMDIVRAIGRPAPSAIFTYGDRIYVPSGQRPGPIVLSHERVHSRQQADAGGPAAWWERYLRDRMFRLEQEVEAYRVEYSFACELIANHGRRKRILRVLSGHLAGPLYGRIISAKDAAAVIT